jgi:hypothetical protein
MSERFISFRDGVLNVNMVSHASAVLFVAQTGD